MKVYSTPAEAIQDVRDGASVLLGGFGLCGIPENLIEALLEGGAKDLTLVSNNAGTDEHGIGRLLKAGRVRRMVMSYGGTCRVFEELVLAKKLEVEWTPQGTLAERLRAGGAGIGGFFTPTGYGTVVSEGKETREIDGRWYVLENPLRADFAFVKAHRGDRHGNLVYRKTARNFNPMMATAGKVAVAEIEEIVEPGSLEADHIHTPGIFVQRLVVGTFEKRIEQRTIRERE